MKNAVTHYDFELILRVTQAEVEQMAEGSIPTAVRNACIDESRDVVSQQRKGQIGLFQKKGAA